MKDPGVGGFHDEFDLPNRPPRASASPLLMLGGGCLLLCALSCGGCFAFVLYVGAVGPNTSVYAKNEIPTRFVDTMKDVGALEEGEQIDYFYSDAFTDIRDSFYFVSDRRVVVYIGDSAFQPITSVPFGEIADSSIERDESFLEDSWIHLELDNGETVQFPVSSEEDRDVAFFELIQKRAAEARQNVN